MRVTTRIDTGARRLTGALTAAQYVEEWRDLVRAEMVLPAGTVREYRLRGSMVKVALRHRSVDFGTFNEIFHHRVYAPPAAALAALAKPQRIVDLGANVGLFGAWARARWPSASIVAVEPDLYSVDVLRRCVAANPRGAAWEVREAAAANRDGQLRFVHGGDWGSRIEDASDTFVSAIDALPLLRGADLAKIDIEGGEWAILLDERFTQIGARAVVLEYHPHLCPEPDAASVARAALDRAGYEVSPVFHAPEGHGVLWAWRR